MNHRLTLALLACLAGLPVRAVPEPARPADDFVDRIGVATHWGYPDTPYGYAYEAVKQLLGEAGIRHVRDGWHARLTDLYDTYGIKATVILGPPRAPRESLAALAPSVAAVDMIEGPNEVDIFPRSSAYRGLTFPAGAVAFQRDLYAAVKANPATAHLGVIAPSTARRGSNLKLAPLADSLDYLVMHSYAGGGPPAGSLEGEFNNLLEATRILGPGATLKPVVVTESGYHTALQADRTLGGVQPGVTEAVQAKYLPRHFAEYFNAGIVRTITYEFINEFQHEATNAEASFGIVHRDLSPKPAYHALKRLIALLGEARWDAAAKRWVTPTVTPRALDLELSGDEANHVHHCLLQQSDGSFRLLLWQEVRSYDTRTQQELTVAPVPITVKVGAPLREATLCRLDRSPAQPLPCPGGAVTVAVPDEVVVLKLTVGAPPHGVAPAAPGGLKAEAGADTATLSWTHVRGATGYFVYRFGRLLGHVAEPSFRQDRLLPDTGYPYEAQAHDAAGQLSPLATFVARTPAIYPDLVVTAVTWTPAEPKPGDAVVFSATVENRGNGPTPEGTTVGVAFHVDGQFVAWSDTLHTALPPGARRTLAANNGPKGSNRWVATAGDHVIRAKVDDVDRINERDEANNECSTRLTVR